MATEGDKYIPNGVWLRCDKGAKPAKLKILPKTVKLYGENWAAQFDAIPYVNIPTFGVCAITHVLCVPATAKWDDVKEDVRIMGQKAILSSSTCQCSVGGTIKIYFSRQAADDAGAEQDAKEKAEFWGKVGAGLLLAGAVVGTIAIVAATGGGALVVLAGAAATGAAIGGVGGAVAGGISGGAEGAVSGFFTGAAFGALGGLATATGAGVIAGGLALGAGAAGLTSLGFLGKAYYHNPSQQNGLVLVGAAASILAGGLTAKGIGMVRPTPGKYLYREDDFPYSHQGKAPGRLKSYIDEEGNLNPANPNGKATVQDHVRGSEPRKSDSPYTSTSAEREAGKSYGNHEIKINARDLERDVKSGKVKEVEILKHEEVVGQLERKRVEAQERYDQNPTDRNRGKVRDAERDIANAKRDKEILVKGKVPAKYVKVKKKNLKMNPAEYPQNIYNLLYTDETGEVIGLDEVQYIEPIPTERIPELTTLLSNEDAYLAYQCGLILTAWGVQEGVKYLRHLVETRIDKAAEFEPHRLWGEDNVYDVIAKALSMALQYTNHDRNDIIKILSEILSIYGECYFESKLKYALIDNSIPELLSDIKKAMQSALNYERYYQASQLLPVLAKYDKSYALGQVRMFQNLVTKDKRINYNIEEMQQYL